MRERVRTTWTCKQPPTSSVCLHPACTHLRSADTSAHQTTPCFTVWLTSHSLGLALSLSYHISLAQCLWVTPPVKARFNHTVSLTVDGQLSVFEGWCVFDFIIVQQLFSSLKWRQWWQALLCNHFGVYTLLKPCTLLYTGRQLCCHANLHVLFCIYQRRPDQYLNLQPWGLIVMRIATAVSLFTWWYIRHDNLKVRREHHAWVFSPCRMH